MEPSVCSGRLSLQQFTTVCLQNMSFVLRGSSAFNYHLASGNATVIEQWIVCKSILKRINKTVVRATETRRHALELVGDWQTATINCVCREEMKLCFLLSRGAKHKEQSDRRYFCVHVSGTRLLSHCRLVPSIQTNLYVKNRLISVPKDFVVEQHSWTRKTSDWICCL